jgi:hypothetical protein
MDLDLRRERRASAKRKPAANGHEANEDDCVEQENDAALSMNESARLALKRQGWLTLRLHSQHRQRTVATRSAVEQAVAGYGNRCCRRWLPVVVDANRHHVARRPKRPEDEHEDKPRSPDTSRKEDISTASEHPHTVA